MTKKYNFSCSKEEWYFSRLFTILYHVDKGALTKRVRLGKDKTKLRKSTWIFVIMLLFSIIGRILLDSPIFSFLILVSIATLFYRVFYLDSKDQFQRTTAYLNNPVVLEDRVDFIILTEDGFYINEVNNFSAEVLPFVKWDSIKSIKLGYCQHYLQLNERVESKSSIIRQISNYFEIVKEKCPSFSMEPRITYHDRLQLKILTKGAVDLSLIALPKDWIDNGQCKLLFEKIEELSRIKVEPPFETGIQALDHLNEWYKEMMK